MSISTEKDVEALRKIGRIVAQCLRHMGSVMEPGMTTLELDEVGDAFLKKHGARSAPQLAYGFPGATCISVNDEAAHGIPGPRLIRAGDLVNIDVSAELDGYFADTGGSFIVPPESDEKRRVCEVAMKAMWKGIHAAQDGAMLNRIGYEMENEAKRHGLTVIRNLCSHGVGRKLHEEPGEICGYFEKRDRRVLKAGQVITVEPFISNGARYVEETGDGWTLVNRGHLTAQYEHTIIVTKGEPLIMTLPN